MKHRKYYEWHLDIPVLNPREHHYNVVRVRVDYDKGGPNIHGQTANRGIYLSVSPMGIQENSVILGVCAGIKTLLEATAKVSEKRTKHHATAVEADYLSGGGLVWEMIRKVCEQEKLTIQSST